MDNVLKKVPKSSFIMLSSQNMVSAILSSYVCFNFMGIPLTRTLLILPTPSTPLGR